MWFVYDYASAAASVGGGEALSTMAPQLVGVEYE